MKLHCLQEFISSYWVAPKFTGIRAREREDWITEQRKSTSMNRSTSLAPVSLFSSLFLTTSSTEYTFRVFLVDKWVPVEASVVDAGLITFAMYDIALHRGRPWLYHSFVICSTSKWSIQCSTCLKTARGSNAIGGRIEACVRYVVLGRE